MHLFTYTISITNTHPTHSIQLLSRYWAFTASSGHRQEVTGEGVIGKQPVIAPGAAFQYASNVNLAERKGRMEGKLFFRLIAPDADSKDVEVKGGRRGGGRRALALRKHRRASKAEEKTAEDAPPAPAVVEGEVTAEAVVTDAPTDAEKESELFDAPVGPVLLATTEVHERH